MIKITPFLSWILQSTIKRILEENIKIQNSLIGTSKKFFFCVFFFFSKGTPLVSTDVMFYDSVMNVSP